MIFVAIVLAGALAYVYMANSSSDNSNVDSDKSTAKTEEAAPDTTVAAEVVKASYEDYMASFDGGDPQEGRKAFEDSSIPEFSATLRGWSYSYDPIL